MSYYIFFKQGREKEIECSKKNFQFPQKYRLYNLMNRTFYIVLKKNLMFVVIGIKLTSFIFCCDFSIHTPINVK